MKVSRPKYTWTPEMEKTLTDMRAEGARFADIAPKLGVSIASAEQRHYKLRRTKNER